MKLKFIYLVAGLCISSEAFAQNDITPISLSAQSNIETLTGTGIGRTYDNRYEGIVGSPFMNKEFTRAKITMVNNVVFDRIPVKYNAYDHAIVYQNGKGDILGINANQVKRLDLTDSLTSQSIVLARLEGLGTVNAKAANSLVIFLYEGKSLNFAALPIKELIKADYKGSSYSAGRTYDEFYDKREYYLKRNNASIEKVKLNKKNLLSILKDKDAAVKKYLSTEKIDASTELGWIKTLAYYESI